MSWPWSELGLSGPADLAAVRHAYAERLKTTHPEEDPEGFQRLNEAYQQARQLARKGGRAAPQAPVSRPVSPPRPAEKPEEPEPEEEGRTEEAPVYGTGEADQPAWRKLDDTFESEAARRAETRERMAQARRSAFFHRHTATTPEGVQQLERHWGRIEAAQTMAEVLYDSNASFQEWVDYLHSSVFLIVKGDPDFVAGFEEFLRQASQLPQQVKQEMARVFSGRDAGQVPQVWHGIYELLTGRTPQTSGPAKPAQTRPFWKKPAFRIVAGILLCLLLVPLGVGAIAYLVTMPGRQARAAMCRYLEEDLGRKVESLENMNPSYANMYRLWDDPGVVFTVESSGERDLAAGRLGYTTDYSNVMLTKALEDFEEEWGCELYPMDQDDDGAWSYHYGDSPEAYRLEVPMWGGDDAVAALGELMSGLQGERWYQLIPPEYELYLVYTSLDSLIWYQYTPEEPFDGPGLLEYYQNEAGPSACAYLVEKSGLAAADFGDAAYRLEPRGTVWTTELHDRTYSLFCVDGVLADTGETVRKYFLDARELYSIPAEAYHADMSIIDLGGDLFDTSWESVPYQLTIWRE